MFIPNSKLDTMELFYPNRKPVGRVKLDLQSWIARDLTVYMPFRELVELAGGRLGSLGGGATLVPDGAYFDGISGYLTLPNVQLDNDFTLTWVTDFASNAGNILQYFISYGAVSTVGSLSVILAGDGTASIGNKTKLWANNSGDTLSLFSTTLYPAINKKTVSLVVQGLEASIYVDGDLEGFTSTFGTAAMPNGTKNTLYLGGRSDLNTARFANCAFSFLSIHKTAMTSDMIRRYHSGLYQTVVPA